MPGSVLVLASASPRRAELLTAAGIPFEVCPAHVDESARQGEDARTYAGRVALAKAQAVAASSQGQPVLAADTVVVIDGQILGKPVDADDARRMLRLLSGRTHEVLTAVALIARNDPGGDFQSDAGKSPPGSAVSYTAVEATSVEFVLLSRAEINWYVSTGEPLDKAGAYAIQGLASRFITRIEGSYSNVVGLPVSLVYAMCTQAGILLS